MTIGTPDSARICRHTSMPSRPGSIRSSSTRSGSVSRNAPAPCPRRRRTTGSKPSPRSTMPSISASAGSSSTTSTRPFMPPSCTPAQAGGGRIESLARRASPAPGVERRANERRRDPMGLARLPLRPPGRRTCRPSGRPWGRPWGRRRVGPLALRPRARALRGGEAGSHPVAAAQRHGDPGRLGIHRPPAPARHARSHRGGRGRLHPGQCRGRRHAALGDSSPCSRRPRSPTRSGATSRPASCPGCWSPRRSPSRPRSC